MKVRHVVGLAMMLLPAVAVPVVLAWAAIFYRSWEALAAVALLTWVIIGSVLLQD